MGKVFHVLVFFLRQDFGSKRKLLGGVVLISILLYSFLELVNLSLLVPLFNFVLEPKTIGKDKYSSFFYTAFSFDSHQAFLVYFSLALVFFFLLKNLFGLVVSYMSGAFSFGIFRFLSDRMYHISILEEREIESVKASEVANQVNIITAFSHNLLLPSLHLINEGVVILMICFTLFFLSTKGFWIALIVTTLAFWFCYRLVKNKLSKTQKNLNDLYPRIMDNIHIGIYGNMDIKATQSQTFFLSAFDQVIDRFAKLQVKNYLLVQAPQKLLEVFVMTAVIGIAVYMSIFQSKGEIIPVMTALGIAAYRMLPSINRVMVATLSINGGYYTMDLVKKLLIKQDINENSHFDKRLPPVEHSFFQQMEVRNVSFTFPSGTVALKKVCFIVNKGETVGIIGKTGSGKTTLLKILLGFKAPSSGSVLIDGEEIHSSGPSASWHHKMGYVQQNIYLMSASIMENIAFGQPTHLVDMERLWQSIRDAKLEEMIQGLPEGIMTKVGEFGGTLSGGQKQRIGIARALYRDCEVLILDEATSALDVQTEAEVVETVAALKKKGKTILIVAHRYSTLRHCDKILELENGSIATSYTYAQLVDQVGKI